MAGNDEIGERREPAGQLVDPLLQCGHHLGRSRVTRPAAAWRRLSRGGRQLGHEHVQVPLEPDQEPVELGLRLDDGPDHAEGGLGLVDRPVGAR